MQSSDQFPEFKNHIGALNAPPQGYLEGLPNRLTQRLREGEIRRDRRLSGSIAAAFMLLLTGLTFALVQQLNRESVPTIDNATIVEWLNTSLETDPYSKPDYETYELTDEEVSAIIRESLLDPGQSEILFELLVENNEIKL